MHILLPPSETKRIGGMTSYSNEVLPHSEALNQAREAVRAALKDLMDDPDVAAKALKLGARSRDEMQHNFDLDSSARSPAVERYTGVLYDALAVDTLEPFSRRWVSEHVSIQSALFGLVSADSLIPAYRLSGSTRLPSLGLPLKRTWAGAHVNIDWSAFGWILDMRSKDYVALAPMPAGRGAFAEIMQRDADGNVRSLNHFNKAAKGILVRWLAEERPDIDSADDLMLWAATKDIETIVSDDRATLQLIFPVTGH